MFTQEKESKRVIFNVELHLARRLEQAKKDARDLGKKLDVDNAVNSALEKFLKKAEKNISDLQAQKFKDEADMEFIRIGPDLDREQNSGEE